MFTEHRNRFGRIFLLASCLFLIQTVYSDRLPKELLHTNRIIIKIRDLPFASESDQKRDDRSEQLAKRFSLKNRRQVFKNARRNAKLKNVYSFEIPCGIDIQVFCKELINHADIEWAEPSFKKPVQLFPNDSVGSFLRTINAPAAWDRGTGSMDVIVAVVDTGVAYNHPDLLENIWVNADEIANDGIDNDNNGYIDDTIGYDFVDLSASLLYSGEDPGPPDNNPSDFSGHGTNVAGVVASRGNNGLGIVGVCWKTSIMALRAGYKAKSGDSYLDIEAIAQAITYAADNGAHVINLSFGSIYPTNTERFAIEYCQDFDILIAAAAGNEKCSTPFYPAAYDNVVAVASVDTSLKRSYFSNYGWWVDISSIGTSIYTTAIGNQYEYVDGTSFASPAFAGSAALIKSQHMDWSMQQVFQRLSSTASDIDTYNYRIVNHLGAGIINLQKAAGTDPSRARVGITGLFIEDQNNQQMDPNETVEVWPSIKNFGPDLSEVTLRLVCGDPYVTVTDPTACIRYIAADTIHTPLYDSFVIRVNPQCPSEHDIKFTIETNVEGMGIVETDQLSLRSNRSMKSLHINDKSTISTDGTLHVDLKVLKDNERIVFFNTQGFSSEGTFVMAQSIIPGQEMTGAVRVFPSARNHSQYGIAVAQDGTIHAATSVNIEALHNEIFYNKRDPVTRTWGSPVRLTTDLNTFYLRSWLAVAVDTEGTVHIVFEDRDAIDAPSKLYHIFDNGHGWSQAQFIAALSQTMSDYPVKLHFTSQNTGILLFKTNDNKLYMIKLLNQRWTTPLPLSTYTYSQSWFDACMDTSDILHVMVGTNNGLYYHTYANGVWSSPSLVPLTNEFNTSMSYPTHSNLELAQDGTMHVVTMAHDLNYYYGYNQFFWLKRVNGTWSKALPITNEPIGFNWTAYNASAIDKDGNLVFLYVPTEGLEWYKQSLFVLLSPDRLEPDCRSEVVDNGVTCLANSNIPVNWTSPQTGSNNFLFAVGTAPGQDDHTPWSIVSGTYKCIMNRLKQSQRYFVSVKTLDRHNTVGSVGYSDGLTYWPTDLSGSDGIINLPDQARLSRCWQMPADSPCLSADLDASGFIDLADLMFVCDWWLWDIQY